MTMLDAPQASLFDLPLPPPLNDARRIMASQTMWAEQDLIAMCLALMGWQAGLSAAECKLASTSPAVSLNLRDVDGVRSQILAGGDPLGDAFSTIRSAQDRRAAEAALVLITDQTLDPSLTEQLQRIDNTWTIFTGDAGAALLTRFPDPDPRAFYIVDPEANIIERFGPDADLTGIRKDFDRLLTWTVRE